MGLFATILPDLVGGLLGVGGSLMSSIFNGSTADRQNALNYRLMQEQNRFNLDMWNRQNEYNTPAAQRARLENAGINPYLALGNVTTGVAQGVTSATPAPAVGAQMENPMLSAVGAAAQIGNLVAQKKLIESQVKKNEEEAKTIRDTREPTIQEILSRVGVSQSQKAYTDELIKDRETFRPYELEQVVTTIQKLGAEVNLIDTQTILNKYSIDMQPLQKQKLEADIKLVNNQIQYLVTQGMVGRAQIANYYAAAQLALAHKYNIDVNTRFLNDTFDESALNIHRQGQLLTSQTNFNDALTQTEGQNTALRYQQWWNQWANNKTFVLDKSVGYTTQLVGAALGIGNFNLNKSNQKQFFELQNRRQSLNEAKFEAKYPSYSPKDSP